MSLRSSAASTRIRVRPAACWRAGKRPLKPTSARRCCGSIRRGSSTKRSRPASSSPGSSDPDRPLRSDGRSARKRIRFSSELAMTKKPDGTWDKSKLPSRHVTEGPSRAPHRSYYYAMGLGTREINQPFVGVASCWNEAAPCNTALMRQAHAVSEGVKAAGGTPREFCTITVTDGIAMGHEGMKSSLVSRDLIADSVELTMRGHGYDALVGVAGCDKSLPGMMMAMLRLNVPSVFLYGGSIMPGRWRGRDVTVVDVFEAVGQHSAGKMAIEDLTDLERHACPGDGACGGQFTANTMACVSEAIGLALPLSSALPAPYESRDVYARKAFENAAVVVAATGGSTNGGLHLPAMAHECGIEFTLRDVAEIFKRTPYLADLKPGGRYVAKDMGEAGGVPVLLKTLPD